MRKGHFTQGFSVFLKAPLDLAGLEPALGSFTVCGRQERSDDWHFGGPSITLVFRPEVNGYVLIDIVDRTWPDDMGDPKKDPKLFSAWGLGQFGPFAFPGNLERATQNCWMWPGGRTAAADHRGFIRIRSSYLFGAGDQARVIPADYDAIAELRFVTDITAALLELPEVLCYFNPNGEVLLDRAAFRAAMRHAAEASLLPLVVWGNVRLFNIDKAWRLMDIVGNGQFDRPDLEACFTTRYDLNEVGNFLRNATGYLITNGEVIRDGDTMDGPGGVRWQARSSRTAIVNPDRRVLSWRPMDGTRMPDLPQRRGG